MSSVLGPLSALASSVTWAVGVSAYSKLSVHHPPAAVNITRALVALPAAAIFAIFTLGGLGDVWGALVATSWQQISWFTLSMFAGYAFGDVLFLLSAKSIGVPAALAIASCFPFWSALAGFFFLGEVLSLLKVCGLVCTVLGTIIVILSGRRQARDLGHDTSSFSYWMGVLLAVATSVLWAVNAYATRMGGIGLPLAIATIWRLGIALVLCPMIAFIMTKRFIGPVPLSQIRRFFFVFVFEGFGGTVFYMYGLAHSSVAVGSALSALSPALSAPIAWATGVERFSLPKTIGILTALLGVILLVSS